MSTDFDNEASTKDLLITYTLAETKPELIVNTALQQSVIREKLSGVCNADGWSTYHRMADVQPAHFANMIDSLDAKSAADILHVRKRGGGCSVAGMFAKHAAKHGDSILRVIGRLDDCEAAKVLRLMDGGETPLAYALVDSQAELLAKMCLERCNIRTFLLGLEAFTADGWSPFHRMADVQPAHFARLLDDLEPAAAAEILCVRKEGGGFAAADLFAKHAAQHGGAIARLVARLSDEAALGVVGKGFVAYVLVDSQPDTVVRMAAERAALRRALMHEETFNVDGWSAYHRLADVEPAHFGRLLDALDAGEAAAVLALCKQGGGCTVSGLFAKHAATHGEALTRLLTRLDDDAAAAVLALADGGDTPLGRWRARTTGTGGRRSTAWPTSGPRPWSSSWPCWVGPGRRGARRCWRSATSPAFALYIFPCFSEYLIAYDGISAR
jgi:hypothetical protein